MIKILLDALAIITTIVVIIILSSLIWYFVLPALVLFFKKIFSIADKLSDKLFKKNKDVK